MGDESKDVSAQNQRIILFDGVCNICNGFVQFIIKRDKRNVFRFGSIQSEASQVLLKQFALPGSGLNSVILLDNGILYTESDAVIRIARELGGFWRFVSWLVVIPKFLRDGVYRLVSRYRYAIFGKRESCMVPTQELLNKFIG